MFVTYVLINQSKSKTYVGHTVDFDKRLKEHNTRKSVFTRKFGPWEVLFKETYKDINESIKKEKYYKSSAGRERIKTKYFTSRGAEMVDRPVSKTGDP